MADRNIVALLQRVVDLLVKLIGDKIELATGQVRAGAEAAGRRAAVGLVGGLIATVGLMLLALAGVEALGALVSNRALRLLIVATPLLVAGVTLGVRVRPGRSGRPRSGAALHHREHQDDDGEDQEHVDPRAERVAAHDAEQPQHDQKRGDHPKHVRASLE
jgi:hypothetical protein